MAFLGPLLGAMLPTIVEKGTKFLGGALGSIVEGKKPIQALQSGLTAAFAPGASGSSSQPIVAPIEQPRAEESPVRDMPMGSLNPHHVSNVIQPFMMGRAGMSGASPVDPRSEFIRQRPDDRYDDRYERENSDGVEVFSNRPRRRLLPEYMASHRPSYDRVSLPHTKTSHIDKMAKHKKEEIRHREPHRVVPRRR